MEKDRRRSNKMYLEDILLSIDRISEYILALDFQQFKADYKTVDAVVRNFEIIREASKNLPKELKQKISRHSLARNVLSKK